MFDQQSVALFEESLPTVTTAERALDHHLIVLTGAKQTTWISVLIIMAECLENVIQNMP